MPAPEPAQSGLTNSPPDHSPAYVEAWKNVLSLGDGLDDARLIAEFGSLSGITSDHIPVGDSGSVEASVDVRVSGEIDLVPIRVYEPTWEHIRLKAISPTGPLSEDEAVQIVNLRVRRYRKR